MSHAVEVLLCAMVLTMGWGLSVRAHHSYARHYSALDEASASVQEAKPTRLAPSMSAAAVGDGLLSWQTQLRLQQRTVSVNGTQIAVTTQGVGASWEWSQDVLLLHFHANIQELVW